jgi:hypothetical protein
MYFRLWNDVEGEDMKSRMEEARNRESAVSGITLEVEELQKHNRDAFQIPECTNQRCAKIGLTRKSYKNPF